MKKFRLPYVHRRTAHLLQARQEEEHSAAGRAAAVCSIATLLLPKGSPSTALLQRFWQEGEPAMGQGP